MGPEARPGRAQALAPAVERALPIPWLVAVARPDGGLVGVHVVGSTEDAEFERGKLSKVGAQDGKLGVGEVVRAVFEGAICVKASVADEAGGASDPILTLGSRALGGSVHQTKSSGANQTDASV